MMGATIAPTPLVIVQNDAEYALLKRRGRFSVPREIAVTFAEYVQDPSKHLFFGRLVSMALDKLVANIGKTHGLEYLPGQAWPGYELRGPTEHVEFSGNTQPDPGPFTKPKAFDDASLRDWETAEKAKAAVKRMLLDVVDYEIVATFRRRLPKTYHTAAVKGHTRRGK